MIIQEQTLYSMHEPTTDSYESDETLSLCDLPLYSDLAQTVEESQQDRFSQSSEQDFFEFYNPSVPGFPPESIVFCGKILTHKKQPDAKEAANRAENKRAMAKIERKRGWGLIRWMVSSDKKRTTLIQKEHLLLFGISRFSSHHELEMRDIKNKQSSSHRRRGQLPPVDGGSGLSRMIRLLSCGGNHHPNTMVVKSTRGVFDFTGNKI